MKRWSSIYRRTLIKGRVIVVLKKEKMTVICITLE